MQPAGDQALLEMRAEIFRLARLCAPGLANLGTITFQGLASNETQRRQWRDSVFVPVLAPAARAAWWAGKKGFREMCAADADLDSRLAGPLAKTSRAAGRLIATSLNAPAGEQGLDRFLTAVLQGDSPGHMAIFFAVRASIFHFPQDVVLAGLAFAEMRTARVEELWGVVEDCLETLPASEPSIFRAA
ncbi:MAG: hypothetical protein WCG66_04205 [bacterium]